MKNRTSIYAVTLFLLISFLGAQSFWAQDQKPTSPDNPPMSMPGGRGMADMPGMNGEASAPAMHSMESRHMDMGPHMKMTTLRDAQPGDAERAAQVVVAARQVAEKYTDYKVALAEGFRIFLPNIPQKQYHFTNYENAFEAIVHFDPDHPTSLLYEKHGDGYKLIGVMYTAAPNATEAELNERIPLSVAQWHAHVNLCLPPPDKRQALFQPNPQFGLQGSIVTHQACAVAGGRFRPQVFGWMVHVYPFEKNPEDEWSVERQHGHMD